MKLKKLLFTILSILFIIVGIMRIQIFIFDMFNQSKYINFYEILIFNHLPNLVTVLACFIVGIKITKRVFQMQ